MSERAPASSARAVGNDDEPWAWPDLDEAAAAALVAGRGSVGGDGGARLEPIGRGDFCLAFRHGTSVVRVARHAEAAAALRREACVLAAVADRLPLAVPRPAHHRPDGCPPFSVHEEIRGAVLTRAGWLGMREEARERAAAELARFLAALHAVPPADVAGCELSGLDSAQLARRLRDRASAELRPLLDGETFGALDAALERWSSTDAAGHGPPSLIHRDVAPGHVLHDPATGALTGVIDFGDVALGEPARDLIYVYEDFGAEMLDAVLRHHPRGRDAIPRSSIRRWYVLEAAAWTLETIDAGRAASARRGLAEIRRELRDGGPLDADDRSPDG